MQITIREPGSALTHFIAMMMALFAASPLLIKAALSGGPLALTAPNPSQHQSLFQ